ncbi:hypothetical protein AVEN_138259-1 [Araneus ventricosus]|uniref:HTH psq-type domain-containing protein n=1 Tax=Araneus ventricosus TaxID=182803 RepID=A0A4Y2KVC4_ARAVE|nr:hypothetical protein AVEN_138259-1 [Araneus ventricosus]
MASKRKNLSFAEKNELIQKFQNSNLSKAAFAKANSIPRTTLNNILEVKLCSSDVQISDQERKRQRLSPYENVDKALLSWSKELLEDDDEDLSLTELAEKLRNRGYAIPDENLHAKIDEDLATNSEASIQDIVSNVLNLNTEGSDDEDDSECVKKSVSTSDALKAIDGLRCFFTNSEAADEHLKAIRDLEKVALTTKKMRHSCISEYFK